MMDGTLQYYNRHAFEYCEQTIDADMNSARVIFLNHISKSAEDCLILDFGCGSGRDAGHFLKQGYRVDALDGSAELAKLAIANTGISVKCMRFQDFAAYNKYHGIWACASILHLKKTELRTVMIKMREALKQEGVIYASFKYGEFEGFRGERYFTDFTEDTFWSFLETISGLSVIKEWITEDVRPDRNGEMWLNVILLKR